MAAPAQETLPEEMVEEILVRVAPEDPATLARAAMANKKWCRLLTGGAFRSKYLAHHRRSPPPMLSFLCNVRERGITLSRYFPAPSSSFGRPRYAPAAAGDRITPLGDRISPLGRPHDARHGRILLRPVVQDRWTSFGLVVWDPITGKCTKVPRPPRYAIIWKAAVFCAATGTAGGEACDHHGCHDGPFKVVYLAEHRLGLLTCIFSSASREWGEPSFHGGLGGFLGSERAAFVKDALHFMFDNQNRILKLDLKTWEMSVILLPYLRFNRRFNRTLPIELIAMENNQRLGFAVMMHSRLCVWSMDETETGWLLCNNIDLAKQIPSVPFPTTARPRMVGIAEGAGEGVGLAFISFGNVVFTVDLKSDKVEKVFQGLGVVTAVTPYLNFCTPVTELPLTDDASRASAVSGRRRQGSRSFAVCRIFAPRQRWWHTANGRFPVVTVDITEVPLRDGASRARGPSGRRRQGKRPRTGALSDGPHAANSLLSQGVSPSELTAKLLRLKASNDDDVGEAGDNADNNLVAQG